MPDNPDPLNAVLARQIAAARPQTLLALGADAAGLLPPLGSAVRICSLPRACGIEALESAWRFDIAVVAGLLERCAKHDAQMLLARLRDVNAGSVLLAVDLERAAARGWLPNDLLALGMQRVGGAQGCGGPVQLFAFDIRRYKTTPDWLNARYWANPHMWDRFRW